MSGVFIDLGSEEGGQRGGVGQRFRPHILFPSGTRIRVLAGNRNPLRWATGKGERSGLVTAEGSREREHPR